MGSTHNYRGENEGQKESATAREDPDYFHITLGSSSEESSTPGTKPWQQLVNTRVLERRRKKTKKTIKIAVFDSQVSLVNT